MADNKTNDFGERLREFAINNFGGISKLANASGIAQPLLSKYINGRKKPSKIIFDRLSAVGCDINWLLTGETAEEKKERFARERKSASADILRTIKKQYGSIENYAQKHGYDPGKLMELIKRADPILMTELQKEGIYVFGEKLNVQFQVADNQADYAANDDESKKEIERLKAMIDILLAENESLKMQIEELTFMIEQQKGLDLTS